MLCLQNVPIDCRQKSERRKIQKESCLVPTLLDALELVGGLQEYLLAGVGRVEHGGPPAATRRGTEPAAPDAHATSAFERPRRVLV